MRSQPAAPISRMRHGEKHRSFGLVVASVLLLPQPAFAASFAADAPTIITFGAIALAIASALWALSTGRLAAHLREAIGQLNAKARVALATRDAIIEGSREQVMVLGSDTEATHAYGDSKALLE